MYVVVFLFFSLVLSKLKLLQIQSFAVKGNDFFPFILCIGLLDDLVQNLALASSP